MKYRIALRRVCLFLTAQSAKRISGYQERNVLERIDNLYWDYCISRCSIFTSSYRAKKYLFFIAFYFYCRSMKVANFSVERSFFSRNKNISLFFLSNLIQLCYMRNQNCISIAIQNNFQIFTRPQQVLKLKTSTETDEMLRENPANIYMQQSQ